MAIIVGAEQFKAVQHTAGGVRVELDNGAGQGVLSGVIQTTSAQWHAAARGTGGTNGEARLVHGECDLSVGLITGQWLHGDHIARAGLGQSIRKAGERLAGSDGEVGRQ